MDTGNRLKQFLNEQANIRFRQLGYSSQMTQDAKREAWWWFKARSDAARKGSGLFVGSTVVFPDPGRCELVRLEEPAAGAGELTVETVASVVSPGTERAQYLRLPNASVSFPYRPGYMAAGNVVAAGRGTDGFPIGARVAFAGPHTSVATVPTSSAFRVPSGVELEEAATLRLGIVARVGLRWADIEDGEPICVIGAGFVGQLLHRVAQAEGSGPVTMIAASPAKRETALAAGVESFLVAGEDDEAIATIGARVVVDATGVPAALRVAVQAARARGRIVLLGSPRGLTAVPLAQIREKGLELVGAHVSTLRTFSERTGRNEYRHEGEAFFEGLAHGRVQVSDLVARTVDPREAGAFYRELAEADVIGARFDWTLLPPEQRLRKGSLLRPPRVTARGVEFRKRPVRRRGAQLVDLDPFAGAAGRLRIGLLGCGDIASQNAAAAVAAPNTQLVACFDPVPELAKDVAHRFGAEATPSAEALVERDDLDAVVLSVPHHLHAPLAIQAAEAKKHVIVEKPLANDLDTAARIVDAARRAGVTLTVCFPQRYQPSIVTAKRLIDDGALGDLSGTLLTYLVDRPASYWIGGYSGRSTSGWRSSREHAGGGVLIMNLCHHLDLLRYLGGLDVATVTALSAQVGGPGDVEDTISASFGYENGGLGAVFGCTSVRGTWDGKSSTDLRLWGRDGHLSVNGYTEGFTLKSVVGMQPTRWLKFARFPAISIRAVFLSRLATALAEGRDPDVTAADALANQAIIEAAYRSSELGQAVRPADLLESSLQ